MSSCMFVAGTDGCTEIVSGASATEPIGVKLLTWINPAHVRFGVGVLLVLYAIYGLARPAFNCGMLASLGALSG